MSLNAPPRFSGVAEGPTPRLDVDVGAPWKLEDAKARFSEVVRKARGEGPQRVTVRGKDAVVVISAEDWQALLPPDRAHPTFVDFMEGLALDGLDLTRADDTGGDVIL